jgi:tRNA nucleotidyltransferase (CCA-adding enzyme)
VLEISEKYRFNRVETQLMNMAFRVEAGLIKLGAGTKNVGMSTLHSFLRLCPAEVLVYLLASNASKIWQDQILTYLKFRDKAQSEINGHDLINMGLKPGPLFKLILDRLIEARLDGLTKTREEELVLIKGILAGKEEV